MSLGVLATVFALILVAELPDKTMIATLVMGSRARPLWVWLGASGAFVVHAAVAVAAGRLLELLPHRVLDAVVAVLFLGGAAYLLLVPEAEEEARGEEAAEVEVPGKATKVVATAFGVILVGEIGDLTQLLTVNLVARFHQPLSVFAGASAALGVRGRHRGVRGTGPPPVHLGQRDPESGRRPAAGLRRVQHLRSRPLSDDIER